jgi:type IV pilus assembly protein PilE
MQRARGFTLLELMIVVAVVAVLAGLALSSYQKQVRKSHRAEAKQIAADYALREEKYRSNNAQYVTALTTLLNVATAPTTWGSGYYTFAITLPTTGTCAGGAAVGGANSFRITASATTVGGQNKDTGCTSMVYDNLCGSVSKTPTACW